MKTAYDLKRTIDNVSETLKRLHWAMSVEEHHYRSELSRTFRTHVKNDSTLSPDGQSLSFKFWQRDFVILGKPSLDVDTDCYFQLFERMQPTDGATTSVSMRPVSGAAIVLRSREEVLEPDASQIPWNRVQDVPFERLIVAIENYIISEEKDFLADFHGVRPADQAGVPMSATVRR